MAGAFVFERRRDFARDHVEGGGRGGGGGGGEEEEVVEEEDTFNHSKMI